MSPPRTLRDQLREFLNFEPVETPVSYKVAESVGHAGYRRERLHYRAADGDQITAFLLLPEGAGPSPAVLVHHQHASQRHLGKSEVAGLAGDPLQAFGPALARQGFVVLAPDSLCFEDRRPHASGTHADPRDEWHHFLEMGHRLVQGDTLMRKLLADASSALSLLVHHPAVDARRIAVLGHSYGGNTALFQAALEPRLSFVAASGALCSYAYKREHAIGLEMALIIPGFTRRWDLHHLLQCIAPRPLLILSADADPYSMDAEAVIARAQPNTHVRHLRDQGGHALTTQRFHQIITFLRAQATNVVE